MKKLLISALLMGSVICACDDEPSRVEIEPYLALEGAVGISSRLVVAEGESGCTYIKGFDFEWGYRFALSVRVRHLRNPPADGSSIECDLERVESRTAVEPGTRFELSIPRGLHEEELATVVGGDCSSGLTFLPGGPRAKQLAFAGRAACDEFLASVRSDGPSRYTFEFDTPSAPLRAVAPGAADSSVP